MVQEKVLIMIELSSIQFWYLKEGGSFIATLYTQWIYHNAISFDPQNLDVPGTYASILFVDFRSSFNAIVLTLLKDKLSQLSVWPHQQIDSRVLDFQQ